jgi:hypothetical protein
VLERVRSLRREQALGDAAANTAESEALGVVRAHVEAARGSAIQDEEFRELLRLTYVLPLDVDAGGVDERAARDLLRTAVLADPNQDEAAWAELLKHVTTCASRRSGASRQELQRVLLGAGCLLRVPRSFEPDVERLRNHSRMNSRRLESLTRIRVGDLDVKITRASTDALVSAFEAGSVLVIGVPGAA